MKRILVTGGAGFISSNMIRYLLDTTEHEVVTMDALTYAGNVNNLADVMEHERLRFIQGDIRDVTDVASALEGIDVIVNAAAESHVSKSISEGGSEFVTTNVVGTQVLLDAMRDLPRGRAVHPDLLVGGLRHGRDRADDRGPPAQPALAVCRHQGRRRPAGLLVLVHVRPADHDHPAVQQLRPVPAPREGHPALHHPGALRPAADHPRRRPRQPRLAARLRHRQGDHGRLRGAARADRRRDDQRRHGHRRDGRADRRHDPRHPRQALCRSSGTSPTGPVRSTATSAPPTAPS